MFFWLLLCENVVLSILVFSTVSKTSSPKLLPTAKKIEDGVEEISGYWYKSKCNPQNIMSHYITLPWEFFCWREDMCSSVPKGYPPPNDHSLLWSLASLITLLFVIMNEPSLTFLFVPGYFIVDTLSQSMLWGLSWFLLYTLFHTHKVRFFWCCSTFRFRFDGLAKRSMDVRLKATQKAETTK